MNERTSQKLERITAAVGVAFTDLQVLLEDEMPVWQRLELQDPMCFADEWLRAAHDLLTKIRMRAQLLEQQHEGFDEIDDAVTRELG